MVDSVKILDSKKYLWDGRTYNDKSSAEQAEATYRKDGFETAVLKEGEQYLVYTRRVVKEVKVEGAPP